jgi:hypothetical protein
MCLSRQLAQKHYEFLRRHEGDPLDVSWSELPEVQREIWTGCMQDLLHSLTEQELRSLIALAAAPLALPDPQG